MSTNIDNIKSDTAQEEFLKSYDDYWNSVYEKNGYSSYEEYAEDYNNWLNGSKNNHSDDDEDDNYDYDDYDEDNDDYEIQSKDIINSNNDIRDNNAPSQMEIDAYQSGQYMMDFEGNIKGSDNYFKRVREYLEKQIVNGQEQQKGKTEDTPQWLKDALAAEQVAKQQAIVKFGYTSPLAAEFTSYTYDLDDFLNNTYMKMAVNASQTEIQYNRQMLKTYLERLHQFLNAVILQYNLNGNGINMYPQIKHDVDIAARMYRDVKNMFSFLK